jgi:hypothetical protein
MIYDIVAEFQAWVELNHKLPCHFFDGRKGVEDNLGSYVAVVFRQNEEDREVTFSAQEHAVGQISGTVTLAVIFVLPELKFKDKDTVIVECCKIAAELGTITACRLDSAGIYKTLYPDKEYRGDRHLVMVDVDLYIGIGHRKTSCICLADYC